jgi:hypothetical protein
MAGAGHRPHRPRRIVLRVADPGHPVTADLHDNAADGMQQVGLVGAANQGLVAVADHAQLPVDVAERFFGRLRSLMSMTMPW